LKTQDVVFTPSVLGYFAILFAGSPAAIASTKADALRSIATSDPVRLGSDPAGNHYGE